MFTPLHSSSLPLLTMIFTAPAPAPHALEEYFLPPHSYEVWVLLPQVGARSKKEESQVLPPPQLLFKFKLQVSPRTRSSKQQSSNQARGGVVLIGHPPFTITIWSQQSSNKARGGVGDHPPHWSSTIHHHINHNNTIWSLSLTLVTMRGRGSHTLSCMRHKDIYDSHTIIQPEWGRDEEPLPLAITSTSTCWHKHLHFVLPLLSPPPLLYSLLFCWYCWHLISPKWM